VKRGHHLSSVTLRVMVVFHGNQCLFRCCSRHLSANTLSPAGFRIVSFPMMHNSLFVSTDTIQTLHQLSVIHQQKDLQINSDKKERKKERKKDNSLS